MSNKNGKMKGGKPHRNGGGRKGTRDHGARAVTSYNPSKTPFPTRMRTRLIYADEFSLSCTADVANTYIFNANSLFDPDVTGVGHQPLGYDQYTPDYNRYRVLGVKYDVIFGTLSAAGSARCSFSHNNGNSIPARPAQYELGNSKHTAVSNSGNPSRVKGYFDLTKLNADPEKYLIDDRYSGLVSGNPTEVMYMQLSVFSSATATIRVMVRFTYDVEFYDVETPTSSSDMINRAEKLNALVSDHYEAKMKLFKRRASVKSFGKEPTDC